MAYEASDNRETECILDEEQKMTVIKETHSIKLVRNSDDSFSLFVHGQLSVVCSSLEDAVSLFQKAYDREYSCAW